jgi:hypothetical protein
MLNQKGRIMKRAVLCIGIILVFISCGTNNSGKGKEENTTAAEKQDSLKSKPTAMNIDSVVKVAEAENMRIESSLKKLKRTILKTTELRDQIKQKWSVIEYYQENGQIVKILTLPYPQISKRTEEFTFKNNKLILAVIADKGIKEGGDVEKAINKEYYYLDDKCIREDNRSKEKEMTIRNSDSERLMEEADEYVGLLPPK